MLQVGREVQSLVVWQDTNAVFFQYFHSRFGVTHAPECQGGVVPEILHYHVLPPGVLVGLQVLRHLVHLVVHHHPGVLLAAVEADLLEADEVQPSLLVLSG